MKKTLILTASIVALTVSSFAQGNFSMVYYDGANGITIGSPASPAATGWYLSDDYSVEAYMAAGAGQSEGSLLPIAASLMAFIVPGPTAAITTAADGGGQWYGSVVDTGLAIGTATIQLRAWYNGGSYATYDLALAGGVNVGKSSLYDIALKANTDPTVLDMNGIGMASFTVQAVPEPGTLVLAGLGLASLFIFRRRKN